MARAVRDVLDKLNIYYEETYQGDDLLFLCPFHDDTQVGSARIDKNLGIYNCFACGAKGNLSTLVSAVLRCTHLEATQFLRSGEFENKVYDMAELRKQISNVVDNAKVQCSRHEVRRILFKFLETVVSKKISLELFQRWYPMFVYFAVEGKKYRASELLDNFLDFQSEILKEKSNG